MKVVQIEGFIMKEDDTDLMTEEFMKKFFPLIEELGWAFGGGFGNIDNEDIE